VKSILNYIYLKQNIRESWWSSKLLDFVSTPYAFGTQDDSIHMVKFDTDSMDLAMDNCATTTMTFFKNYFVTLLKPPVQMNIVGAGGTAKVLGVGDVKYKITDDDGVDHNLLIKDAFMFRQFRYVFLQSIS